ncbi:MAG: DUF7144 family membrane protein [Gammaproteobacteria bacterium]
MRSRPLSISIIAWLFIIASVISLIGNLVTINNPAVKNMMEQSPIPMNVQYVMMYLGVVILFICGLGFLKGKNWARILYVIWGILGIIMNFVILKLSPILIPGIVFFVIIIFFLYRPKANLYFAGKDIA